MVHNTRPMSWKVKNSNSDLGLGSTPLDLDLSLLHFSIPNPILMLIHDVGDFGMLIVGIPAGPSLKWHLLLRFRQGHLSSIVLNLYKYLIFFFSFFFFCIHSYRFFFLIVILPFSQIFDVCLSSLLSCCLWTLTTFHWHRRLRQWRWDFALDLDSFPVFKTYVSSFIRTFVRQLPVSFSKRRCFGLSTCRGHKGGWR